MSRRPLAIAGMGMISCLGEGAEVNAAAMRCDYDGFSQTTFNQPFSSEPQLGAQIETELRGIPKLTYMNKVAVKEAIKDLPEGFQGLTVIYCMPEKSRQSFFNNEEALHEIMEDTFQELHLGALGPASSAFWQHRCGFVSALKQAQELLYTQGREYVLIVSIDSLLNTATLSQYGGGLYSEERRLLGNGHSNGFIPGEAATAILLTKPITTKYQSIIISGIGEGQESATLNNEEEVLRGSGLSEAIKLAAQQAQIEVHDTQYRVSSVSGEQYFFKEAALALSKSLKRKVPEHQLLHPSDCIGEIGAAVGGAMLIMDYYAHLKKYSIGKKSIHIISNDNQQRGAYIVENTNG